MFDWSKLLPWNWNKADTPDNYVKKDFTKGVQAIPSGAIILYRSRKFNIFSWLIRALTGKWSNHLGIYFGSGCHETVEAIAEGVKKTTLDKSMNNDSQLKVFVKTDLTVLQLATIKGYAYGSVGKHYAVEKIITFDTPETAAQQGNTDDSFCSELGVNAYWAAGLNISDKPADKSAPGDVETFLLSDKGKAQKWILFDTYNVK